MYTMYLDTYFLIAIIVANATWFIGGIFRTYTVKKLLLIASTIIVFSTVIPYMIIVFEICWGSLQYDYDSIAEAHLFITWVPIPNMAGMYFSNNIWRIVAADGIGIVVGSVVCLIKDTIRRKRRNITSSIDTQY